MTIEAEHHPDCRDLRFPVTSHCIPRHLTSRDWRPRKLQRARHTAAGKQGPSTLRYLGTALARKACYLAAQGRISEGLPCVYLLNWVPIRPSTRMQIFAEFILFAGEQAKDLDRPHSVELVRCGWCGFAPRSSCDEKSWKPGAVDIHLGWRLPRTTILFL